MVSTSSAGACRRATRVLAAWLADHEVPSQILGRTPMPSEDLSELLTETVARRQALSARPLASFEDPTRQGDPIVIDKVTANPDVQAAFADVPWRAAWVDLTRVIALQKFVVVDGLQERVHTVQEDESALLDLCFPEHQAVPITVASEGAGFTFSSPNPNLRVRAMQCGQAQTGVVPGAPTRTSPYVTIVADTVDSYLHVAHYRGRYFLRDGYHRAAGLLRVGVQVVPAVIAEAPTFEWVSAAPGLLSHDIAFGDRPPLLGDFWDEAVAADGSQPSTIKVIRFRPDEFPIQAA